MIEVKEESSLTQGLPTRENIEENPTEARRLANTRIYRELLGLSAGPDLPPMEKIPDELTLPKDFGHYLKWCARYSETFTQAPCLEAIAFGLSLTLIKTRNSAAEFFVKDKELESVKSGSFGIKWLKPKRNRVFRLSGITLKRHYKKVDRSNKSLSNPLAIIHSHPSLKSSRIREAILSEKNVLASPSEGDVVISLVRKGLHLSLIGAYPSHFHEKRGKISVVGLLQSSGTRIPTDPEGLLATRRSIYREISAINKECYCRFQHMSEKKRCFLSWYYTIQRISELARKKGIVIMSGEVINDGTVNLRKDHRLSLARFFPDIELIEHELDNIDTEIGK